MTFCSSPRDVAVVTINFFADIKIYCHHSLVPGVRQRIDPSLSGFNKIKIAMIEQHCVKIW